MINLVNIKSSLSVAKKARAFGVVVLMASGVALLSNGCTKTTLDQLAGTTNTCDTTHVSYTQNILPIMQSYCFACHGNGHTAFSNGVNLQGSDNGYQEVVGWAEGGYVIGNVTYSPGFIGMPYGKPKIDQCSINMIQAWIDQNYPH